MAPRKIIVTRQDYSQLTDLLKDRLLSAIAAKPTLRDLAGELQRACIVDASRVPSDVVTMNSIVTVTELESGETDTYTLVFPANANIAEGRLSVIAPVGTAILGYRVGDRVRWKVPAGMTTFQIVKVSQPAGGSISNCDSEKSHSMATKIALQPAPTI